VQERLNANERPDHARTQLTERDVFIDVGSGLGHVSLLASICAGTRCIGIEVEAAYVNCARQSAYELNLNNVTFIHRDARSLRREAVGRESAQLGLVRQPLEKRRGASPLGH